MNWSIEIFLLETRNLLDCRAGADQVTVGVYPEINSISMATGRYFRGIADSYGAESEVNVPLHILLADDHAVVRQGLRALLERAGFEVVGEAGDGQEAIQLAEKFHPDIAVLDVAMPLLNGIDAARGIGKASPRTKTILLTMYVQGRNVLEGLRTGVRGVVVKSKAFDELLRAIQTVCKGNTYLSPEVSNFVVDGYVANCPDEAPSLRDRERQVLQLVAEGKTTKEIATVLGISVKTAESHRMNIMERLDIHDTAGLVRYAIRQGLIQP